MRHDWQVSKTVLPWLEVVGIVHVQPTKVVIPCLLCPWLFPIFFECLSTFESHLEAGEVWSEIDI